MNGVNRQISSALPRKKITFDGANADDGSDDGGMLNDFNSNRLSDDDEEEEEEEEEDKLFALGEDHATLNRVTRNFKIATSRALNNVSIEDY